MELIKVTIHTSRQGIEAVTTELQLIGIDEAEVHDPEDIREILSDKSRYNWDHVDDDVAELVDTEPLVILYFENDKAGEKKVKDLKIRMMMLKSKEMEGLFGWDADLGRLYVEDEILDDDIWKNKWKEYFKPVQITNHIVVKPSWEEYSLKEGQSVIEIDPGMAFGTGTHETTSMCIVLLEKYIKEGDVVVDAGCGSGILSMASVLCGCNNVVAIDIDKDALRVSEENIKLNHMEDKIKIVEGDLSHGLDNKGNVIVANLTDDLIVSLLPGVQEALSAGGVMIISGILAEKEAIMISELEEHHMTVIETLEKGDWCAIAAACCYE